MNEGMLKFDIHQDCFPYKSIKSIVIPISGKGRSLFSFADDQREEIDDLLGVLSIRDMYG